MDGKRLRFRDWMREMTDDLAKVRNLVAWIRDVNGPKSPLTSGAEAALAAMEGGKPLDEQGRAALLAGAEEAGRKLGHGTLHGNPHFRAAYSVLGVPHYHEIDRGRDLGRPFEGATRQLETLLALYASHVPEDAEGLRAAKLHVEYLREGDWLDEEGIVAFAEIVKKLRKIPAARKDPDFGNAAYMVGRQAERLPGRKFNRRRG